MFTLCTRYYCFQKCGILHRQSTNNLLISVTPALHMTYMSTVDTCLSPHEKYKIKFQQLLILLMNTNPFTKKKILIFVMFVQENTLYFKHSMYLHTFIILYILYIVIYDVINWLPFNNPLNDKNKIHKCICIMYTCLDWFVFHTFHSKTICVEL